MSPLWQPEIVVDAELAAALIEAQFPSLRPVAARLLASGWDNTAFLVNDLYVFRFPRRQVAVPLIKTEADILPWLARLLPVAIPRPTLIGASSDRYPWPFAGYRRLNGRELARARLADNERAALAEPLAAFLRALHRVSAVDARRRGAPGDTLDRLNIDRRAADTKERLDAVQQQGLAPERHLIEQLLARAPRDYTPRSDVVVHGDLHAGQILIDDNRRMSAVIDWGDVHIGDPAVDLAAVHALLPLDAHDAFLAAYGAVDSIAWELARARAAWHSVALLAHAVDTGDSEMTIEASGALRRLTETRR